MSGNPISLDHVVMIPIFRNEEIVKLKGVKTQRKFQSERDSALFSSWEEILLNRAQSLSDHGGSN